MTTMACLVSGKYASGNYALVITNVYSWDVSLGDDTSVSDSTVSTLTTARTLDTMPTVQTNEESIGNTTISTLTTEGTATVHTDATSIGAYREDGIEEASEMQIPTGEVTIVYADVKADNLWETCPDAMQQAQDTYDIIMRRCYADHRGYEVSSGGVSFNLAFQNPVDALAFALQAQVKLYNASWPGEFLTLDMLGIDLNITQFIDSKQQMAY